MRILLAAALLCLVALVAGCMGPTFIVQQYGGPQRPRETISILRVNGFDAVRLLFLDEEDVAAPIASDGRLHIELLPGRHTLTARNGDDRSAPTATMAFLAEPNNVYRVIFTGDAARVFEVDRDSDKPRKDATLPTSATPPVQPPPVIVPLAGSAASPSPTGSPE